MRQYRRKWVWPAISFLTAGWALILLAASGSAQSRTPMTAAEEMEGYAVRSPSGEAVGTVEKVLIDLRGGRIVYLLVRPPGGKGEGAVVPWKALRVDPERKSVILRVQADRVRFAPFGQDDVGDRERARAIHQYYGVSPNSEAPRAPSAPRGLRIVR